ncbi:hypothetical protein FZ934_05445 [Rhizobium grahamii]|uniref:Pentapeptide repeat-containing protein n=1 Tax=Rhizobium grahamii TaxID=1120045 RepID=A0A5Q0C217_9HYPH|nr:hypothetical protein [Rhizobium grahamii]QFY59926.1 hypothetical protein FZ934_05445 [Rhizobium grahamii]
MNALEKQQAAQAFAPFFLGAAGFVTFCGAVWRGKLNSEQIKQQIRQNNSNDDANYAKLLQEGAKMLTEKGDRAHLLAGIATLEPVLSDPQRRFSQQAMDVIGDYIATNHAKAGDRIIMAGIRAMGIGVKAGVRSTLNPGFKKNETDAKDWLAAPGFASQRIEGGRFRGKFYETIRNEPHLRFDNVRFEYCRKIGDHTFTSCNFVSCSFATFDEDHFALNKFDTCDFSGCIITSGAFGDITQATDLKDRGNYFFDDDPPVKEGIVDWSVFLNAKSRRKHSQEEL